MNAKPNREDRKAILKRLRSEGRARERALLPLPNEELQAMFDMLSDELSRVGCNHTRRLTQAWLEEHGHPVKPVFDWLDAHSGYCDCQVLSNTKQAWEDCLLD